MKYTKHQLNEYRKSELENAFDEYIIGFKAERNKHVMKRHYCDGLTFEEIAEELDMSVMQIKNITYRYCDIISKHLEVRA